MYNKLQGKIYFKNIKSSINMPPNIYDIKYDESNFYGTLECDIPNGSADIYVELNSICILKNMTVYSDEGVLEYINLNGINVENLDIFIVENPKINIKIADKKAKFLTMKCEIYMFSREHISLLTKLIELCKNYDENKNNINLLNKEISELVEYKQKYDLICEEKRSLENKVTESLEYAEYKQKYFDKLKEAEELQNNLVLVKSQYDCILSSNCWRITKPVRVVLDCIKSIGAVKAISKVSKSLRTEGLKGTYSKIKNKLCAKNKLFLERNNILSEDDIKYQQSMTFSKNVKISILFVICDSSENNIYDTINSVINQTYQNWELCISFCEKYYNKRLEKIVKEFVKVDNRIKYQRFKSSLTVVTTLNNIAKISTGEYVTVLTDKDMFAQNALFEFICKICNENADLLYCDEDKFENNIKKCFDPYFKVDYSPDTLRTHNCIANGVVVKKSLFNEVGRFNAKYVDAYDYDFILKLTEKAQKIVHISKVLYHKYFKNIGNNEYVFPKKYNKDEAKAVIAEHLKRINKSANVLDTAISDIYKIDYKIYIKPIVSIIILNKDKISYLKKCIDSIIQKTTYKNYEIIIVENNSVEPQTFEYYKKLKSNNKIKILTYDKSKNFNFSAINNFAVKYATGDMLILLNNDIEIISPDWIQEMMMYVQFERVGIVGAKLYYPNNTIQHVGVGVGLMGVAAHFFWGVDKDFNGYFGRMHCTQNIGAVTGACVMLRKSVFEEVNGLDEGFAIAYNDIDLCLKIRQAGYDVIFTPYAELYHAESVTRGYSTETPEKNAIEISERRRFVERWKSLLEKGDPYYSVHLPQDRFDFKIL